MKEGFLWLMPVFICIIFVLIKEWLENTGLNVTIIIVCKFNLRWERFQQCGLVNLLLTKEDTRWNTLIGYEREKWWSCCLRTKRISFFHRDRFVNRIDEKNLTHPQNEKDYDWFVLCFYFITHICLCVLLSKI